MKGHKSSGNMAASGRDKQYFDLSSQSRGYASNHGKGVTAVVGVLQPANHGSSGAYFCRQFPLAESGPSAKLINLAGEIRGSKLLFKVSRQLRVFADITVIGKLESF